MEDSLYAVAYSEPSRNPCHAPGKWVLPVLFTDEDTKPRQVKVTQSGQSQTQPRQSTVLCNKILWGASGFLSKASGNQAGPASSPEQLRGSKAQGIGQCEEGPLRGGCPENLKGCKGAAP